MDSLLKLRAMNLSGNTLWFGSRSITGKEKQAHTLVHRNQSCRRITANGRRSEGQDGPCRYSLSTRRMRLTAMPGRMVHTSAGIRTSGRSKLFRLSYRPPLPKPSGLVVIGGFRSQLPLRDSPGFAPGSLLRRSHRATRLDKRRTDCAFDFTACMFRISSRRIDFSCRYAGFIIGVSLF